MDSNLVDLFTNLSQEILKNELDIGNDEFERKKKNGVFNKYIGKLRQKCFDVVFRNQPEVDYSDPCKTPYGADWSPSILLLDYGGELAKYGLEQTNILLYSCIKKLEDKGVAHINELFKLIFILRDSCSKPSEELKSDFLSTVSQYSLKSNSLQSMMQNDHSNVNKITVPSELITAKYSTGLFESGCQLLNKISDRSIPVKLNDKEIPSFDIGKINDQSKYVTSDFDIKKIVSSSSSFRQLANNLYSSNHCLWDNFVEKPISYRLRNRAPSTDTANVQTNSCRADENCKNGLKVHKTKKNEIIKNCDNYWTHMNEVQEHFNSIVKSKFDNGDSVPNEHYFYPILMENVLKLGNYESCFVRKMKSKRRIYGVNAKSSFFNSSASLILALWEQEYKFRYTYEIESEYYPPELRVLELNGFLRDVKLLLVGIATDTFRLDKENMSFYMTENTCLEGVTPNALINFSVEYLDIGTCYVRLRHCTDFSLKKQILSGFKDCRIISKAFLMSVYDFLCRHNQYVLKVPVTLGLLEFKTCVRNLQPVISAVADFCKVTEDIRTLPQGGQLLTYLLRTTTRITNKCTAAVFLGFLKTCCETYLINLLQDWIFQGHLNRHHADFFVEHRPKKMRHKDRTYYLSFCMIEDRAPSFLKGLENKIFSCGKTVHLLKLIQPESKLCRLLETRAYPKIKLCLSEEELQEQQTVFNEYLNDISRICGKFASIESLRQDEINRESLYEKYILEVKKEQERKREIQKKESTEEMRRRKEEQNKCLTKQLKDMEEDMKRKKERKEIESKLFMEEARRIADAEKRVIEEEKLNMKMYYKELMHQIEKRAETVSWRQHSKRLNEKNALLRCKNNNGISVPSNKQESDSALKDEHTMIDSEGNLILNSAFDKVKVNSNTTETKLELLLEDLENKNAPDSQLEMLIESRKDYQSLTESALHEDLDQSKTFSASQMDNHTQKDININLAQKMIESRAETVRKDTEIAEKNTVSIETEAQRNKRKVLGSEFELWTLSNTETRSNISNLEKDSQKNKREVMTEKYGTGDENEKAEPKVIAVPKETEAQRNKRKILSSEFGMPESEVAISHLPKMETEAQKNKDRVLTSEYEIFKIEKTERVDCPPPAEETEAQKNKKKVMASEFGLGPEIKEVSKRNEIETEAQKNKRKIMECEFGESKEISIARRVISAEAQRNKEKVLGIEYGCQKELKKDDSKEFVLSTAENCTHLERDVYLSEEYDVVNSGIQSSFTEKSLEIFNKTKSLSSDLRFFTLAQTSSDELTNDNDVHVIFHQRLRKIGIKDWLTEIGCTDMDVTKFMNLVRRSVLIPLQIQDEIANKALFSNLLKDENLLLHFNALRNYFFLNDGEFSRRLTQNIFATLAKCTEPQQFFKRSTLNKIVYEALNFTIHCNEPCIQNVSFEIVEMPKFLSHASHDVLSPFELSYHVKWPLNIILTEKALSKYKKVFHFLLKLKRINWTLNENFSYLTYSCRDKRICSRQLINSHHYHKIHVYRHAMSQFMRTLENYISSCSLQYSWLNFQKDLESVKNLDHLYEKHVKYVKEVLKRCFLTSESHELESYINSLIELSLKFHYSTKTGKWILVGNKYQNSKFEVLKATFAEFCILTTEFLKTLRKKINIHHDLRPHEILMEKFDLIL